MNNPEESLIDKTFALAYDGPQRQLVDFGSRFGVWWDRDSSYFGIDHGAVASQREGKHFMAPVARLGLLDGDSGEVWFIDAPAQRRAAGHPWGVVQEGEAGHLRLRVTVTYAALDVVAVKIEVQNTGTNPRALGISLQAQTVPEDWNRSVVVHAAAGEVITTQTSAPTSRFQIRPEPHIDIVTGWRVDFEITRRSVEGGGFCAKSECFSLLPEENRTLSLFVSAASGDSGTADRLTRLVRNRLGAETRPPDEVIRAAQQRWADTFRAIRADEFATGMLGADACGGIIPLVRHGMMILLRNTVRAQPEQGYGAVLGTLRGTFPCRFSYEGFWIWDSAFQALGFAEWDLGLAKDNIRVMLRNQRGDGGLPMLHPDAAVSSAQPPLLTWAAMEIYAKERPENPDGARGFVTEVYPKLALWNRWWFSHRDKNGNGLAEWGNNLESGWDDSPRWDNVDGSAGWDNDYGSALYEAVDLNAYLILDLRSLGQMAAVLGLPEEARGWDEAASALARRVVEVLYDPKSNLFFDTNYVTGEHRKVLTPASFLPLWAGVPLPEARAHDMIKLYLLSGEHFFGTFPFPSVCCQEATHDAGGRSGYWRGPIWLNIAYFMIQTLAWHGFKDEARQSARKILEMVARAGIHENYNSQTGEPGDNSRMDFSWSAALAVAIALGDLTHTRPRPSEVTAIAPRVHISVRVRDRRIYGRAKGGWLHLANRTDEEVSGRLLIDLAQGWGMQIRARSTSAEELEIDASTGFAFRLGPGARQEWPVRFLVPDTLEDRDYRIGLAAVANAEGSVGLGSAVLCLAGPPMAPLPWLTEETAASLMPVLFRGDPFYFTHDGREIGRSAPGLLGMLNGRQFFLDRQSLAKHVARRDFIKHSLHLLKDLTCAESLRRELETLLDPGLSPRTADDQAQELLETVVQQTRDLIGG